MKITTWNVNGYRAVFEEKSAGLVARGGPRRTLPAGIKVQRDQLTDEEATLEGYEVVWNPAERKGYSGTATFHKQFPDGVEKALAWRNLTLKAG